MHEVAIAQALLSTAIESARAAGLARLTRLHIFLGLTAGVAPDALTMALQVVSHGTPADGAALEFSGPGTSCYLDSLGGAELISSLVAGKALPETARRDAPHGYMDEYDHAHNGDDGDDDHDYSSDSDSNEDHYQVDDHDETLWQTAAAQGEIRLAWVEGE